MAAAPPEEQRLRADHEDEDEQHRQLRDRVRLRHVHPLLAALQPAVHVAARPHQLHAGRAHTRVLGGVEAAIRTMRRRAAAAAAAQKQRVGVVVTGQQPPMPLMQQLPRAACAEGRSVVRVVMVLRHFSLVPAAASLFLRRAES